MTWTTPVGTRFKFSTCPKKYRDNPGRSENLSRTCPTVKNADIAGRNRVYGTRGQVLSKESVERKKRVIARIYTRVSTYRECIGDFWSLVPPHARKPSRTSVGQSRKTTRRHRLQIHQPRSRWSARPASPTPTLSSSLHRSQSTRTKTTATTGAKVRPDQTTGTPGTHRGPSLTNRGGAR